MDFITVDVRLYGELSRYGNSNHHTGKCVNFNVQLPQNSTVKSLMDYLLMCTHERGFTFINEKLSARPNYQPDLDFQLQEGDQVTFYPLKMLPTAHDFDMKVADRMRWTVQADGNVDSYYLNDQGQG
jgi:hypothetical protein